MKVLFISANKETVNIIPLPLGLHYVAAATRHAGHEVRLLDLMMEADPQAAITEAITSFHPDVIGISVRNIDSQNMENPRFVLDEVGGIITLCRHHSGAPVVLGGAGYSIFPEPALAYLQADMGIQGEGELAFPALLERLAQKRPLSDFPGLYLPGRGLQGKRAFGNLDVMSVEGVQEFSSPHDRKTWVPVQTRRGCPLECSYCSTATIEGRRIRKRAIAAVLDEMAGYVEAGFRWFCFVDNTFNLPVAYAKALCRGLIGRGWPISWRCILYPGRVDDELAGLMAKAGCQGVGLGFESGCERVLQSMNKKFSQADVRVSSQLFADHGIDQQGFLMLGGPGETKATVQDSIAFADSLPLDSVKITMGIRIYPFTALARQAVADRMVAPEDSLLFPRFYMAAGLGDWLRKTVKACMAERPHWIF